MLVLMLMTCDALWCPVMPLVMVLRPLVLVLVLMACGESEQSSGSRTEATPPLIPSRHAARILSSTGEKGTSGQVSSGALSPPVDTSRASIPNASPTPHCV